MKVKLTNDFKLTGGVSVSMNDGSVSLYVSPVIVTLKSGSLFTALKYCPTNVVVSNSSC